MKEALITTATPPVMNGHWLEKLLQAVAIGVILGALGWFVSIDRNMTQINERLSVMKSLQTDVAAHGSRIQRIEDTRFTIEDAKQVGNRLQSLEQRIRLVEERVKE